MADQAHFSAVVDMGPAFRVPKGSVLLDQLEIIKTRNADPEPGDQGEAVDMVIGALALFYARGGDHTGLIEMMEERIS